MLNKLALSLILSSLLFSCTNASADCLDLLGASRCFEGAQIKYYEEEVLISYSPSFINKILPGEDIDGNLFVYEHSTSNINKTIEELEKLPIKCETDSLKIYASKPNFGQINISLLKNEEEISIQAFTLATVDFFLEKLDMNEIVYDCIEIKSFK